MEHAEKHHPTTSEHHQHHHPDEQPSQHTAGHGAHDHHGHHAHMLDDFKQRFWVSLVLTIPILILSPMIQSWLGYELRFTGDRYVVFGLASILFFYGGWPFLTGMIDELRSKNPGMMTLIALAITVAYVYSVATVFGLEGEPFFWELATLIVVMLAGHWIEMRSVMNASNALEKLMELMPNEAHLIEGDTQRDVAVSELQPGQLILVKPGEKMPADGFIKEGKSFLDEAVLTGESKPVEKQTGDEVIAGAINGKGSLRVEVKNSQENSYLSQVIRLVDQAQQEKSKTQHLADRAAFWLTIVALTAGAVTLGGWLAVGQDFNFALTRMVTVMVIACPHALGLAIPLVVAISTSISAKNQLLIRNRTAFENARKIDTLLFDKTGTLTQGNFVVTRYQSVHKDFSDEDLLRLAASLEQSSEHPIATGILTKAKDLSLKLSDNQNFQNMTGEGIQGEVAGKSLKIVSPGRLQRQNVEAPEGSLSDEADTVVFMLVDNELVGYLALADEIRATSQQAIRELKEMSIDSYMITGDNERVAKAVSEKLGMQGYFAEVLPDQKQEKVKELQQQGKFVAMTGDGVNDAPALAQANVGIAVGSGTDVAAETADIVLVESDPRDVVKLIRFGRATYRKMIQNLLYATAYNVVAIPLGAGVLYSAGIMIDPAVGAIFMSLSTVAVAINAQFLRKSMQ